MKRNLDIVAGLLMVCAVVFIGGDLVYAMLTGTRGSSWVNWVGTVALLVGVIIHFSTYNMRSRD